MVVWTSIVTKGMERSVDSFEVYFWDRTDKTLIRDCMLGWRVRGRAGEEEEGIKNNSQVAWLNSWVDGYAFTMMAKMWGLDLAVEAVDSGQVIFRWTSILNTDMSAQKE